MLMNKNNYIRAVLAVFWLLFLTRIPAFIMGNLDAITVVSTVVELGFFIWGILILRTNQQVSNPDNQRIQEQAINA